MPLKTFGAHTFAAATFASVTLHGAGQVEVESTRPSGGRPETPRYHPWIHGVKARKRHEEEERTSEEVKEAIVEAVVEARKEAQPARDYRAEIRQATAELKAFLRKQDFIWMDVYATIIKLEYERQEQEYQDAQIVMLLFEM